MDRGEACLSAICEASILNTVEREGVPQRFVALKVLGDPDARSIVVALRKLEDADLVTRETPEGEYLPKGHWRATPRGWAVDRILDNITDARGGKFMPRLVAGITHFESAALR